MEYSKEDLMEAKKQSLGVGENMGTEESKKIWEAVSYTHLDVYKRQIITKLCEKGSTYFMDKRRTKRGFTLVELLSLIHI